MANDDPAPRDVSLAFDWLSRRLGELSVPTRAVGRDPETAGAPPPSTEPAPAAGPPAPAATPLDTTAQTDATRSTATSAPSGWPMRSRAREEQAPRTPTPASVTAEDQLVSSAPAGPLGASASATPLLDKVGRDLTALAHAGQLPVVLGREAEIDAVIEILVRSRRHNPLLVAPEGTGRTALVEGLAARIAAGDVPALLRGRRIIEVSAGDLTAGTQYRGQLEERLGQFTTEAARPDVILFFPDIHLLAGAGTTESSAIGADAILGPALARGEITVIGTTTPDEERRRIARSPSLAGQFMALTIREIGRDLTRRIMLGVRDGLAVSRGVRVSDAAIDVLLAYADARIANRRFPDKALDLLEAAVANALVAGRSRVDRTAAVRVTELYERRVSATPTLVRFGRDLRALARDNRIGPVIGRDAEIDLVIETVMRSSKRNPLLLGPAGSGKTAIVEGFAIRLETGAVPASLRDQHLFDVPLTGLADAIEAEPELLSAFLAEASHPQVIVFFDEIHLLTRPAVRKLAEALKPALARGEIACVGATTGPEYQQTIEPEAAIARRFSPISITPMDEAAVAAVLRGVRDKLAGGRGVAVDDAALAEITTLATQWIPNRAFPDKGVDLIEQSVAYALTHGLTAVDPPVVRLVVARMVGMPLDPAAALASLRTDLGSAGVLDQATIDSLVGRLGSALRGVDARPERPNASVLLTGSAAGAVDGLASAIATGIYGRATARIDIELASMSDDSAVSTLLGSAPGLIGSERPLPLHELTRSPFSVVVLRNVDRCSDAVCQAIVAALEAGAFTDAMGRRLPLGGAVVLMTGSAVPGLLDPELLAACDLVVEAAAPAGSGSEDVQRLLLAPLAVRFARTGVTVTFGPEFAAWVASRQPGDGEAGLTWLDRVLVPALVASMPPGATSLTAEVRDDRPVLVEPAGITARDGESPAEGLLEPG
jgi:ATP-dependent Clp protease ATP-binding subunit ClpA